VKFGVRGERPRLLRTKDRSMIKRPESSELGDLSYMLTLLFEEEKTMVSLSSLMAFVPIGLGLVILGVAVGTAIVDSWWSQRPRQPAGEAAVESCTGVELCTRSKAA